jgi:hypothetical protein
MTASKVSATAKPSAQKPAYPLGKVMIAWLIVTAISSVLNYALFWLATGPLGIESNFGPFASPPGVAIFNALFLLIAAFVFWFVAQRSANVPKTWNTVALVGLVISLLPNVAGLLGWLPSELGEVSFSAMMILIIMHVVSYLVAVWGFPRFGKA